MKPLKIGTRGSALALWQARSIAAQLAQTSGVESEIIIIKTSGDKFQQIPFAQMATKGVFIKELEDALLERRVDLAVHSMKDVPTEIAPELTIAAICKRQDVHDALLSTNGAALADLPQGARVGTSSLRRQSQLLHARRDLQMLELRGNVDTRIEKLKRGDYDAIVLAKAGLDRLGLSAHITEVLSTDVCLPATGQGAIGIEARSSDPEILHVLAALNDEETRAGVSAERSALGILEGGCQASIGAWGRMEAGQLALDVAVLSPDGLRRMSEKGVGRIEEATLLGERVAGRLRDNGAAALLVREGHKASA